MASPFRTQSSLVPSHPVFPRRFALQAGGIGLLGLAGEHLGPLRSCQAAAPAAGADACIYIFLSGGLAQHESFDPKPDAPAEIRGEFATIQTATEGLRISEHLPKLAACSRLWSVVRSLTHSTNDHSAGHLFMLSGRSSLPAGFDPMKPRPQDWPSLAATVGAALPARNNLPPAIMLPEKLIHRTGRVIPGQFGGLMGRNRDPWFLEVSPFDSKGYGAFPTHEFDHLEELKKAGRSAFHSPSLFLPEGVGEGRLAARANLLSVVDAQRADLERTAGAIDAHREAALSLLLDGRVRQAVDLERETPQRLERYGRNSFGWSLLMARRLVEAGVRLVQVHLGNNETWDTHGNAFPHLKDKLLPPMDQAVSALLEDLQGAGLLSRTLVVMGSEFGRTPKISKLDVYRLAGRDHWGAVQSVLAAGGGVVGGRVVGASDRIGGWPAADPQAPENLAATIYHALGIPASAEWRDEVGRPHFLYHGEPIRGLI